jgi:hypothetical protein
MVDQVLPNRVMAVHGEGNLQLGPNAINARDQHRLLITFRIERKQAPESSHFSQHPWTAGGGQELGQPTFDPIS